MERRCSGLASRLERTTKVVVEFDVGGGVRNEEEREVKLEQGSCKRLAFDSQETIVILFASCKLDQKGRGKAELVLKIMVGFSWLDGCDLSNFRIED